LNPCFHYINGKRRDPTAHPSKASTKDFGGEWRRRRRRRKSILLLIDLTLLLLISPRHVKKKLV